MCFVACAGTGRPSITEGDAWPSGSGVAEFVAPQAEMTTATNHTETTVATREEEGIRSTRGFIDLPGLPLK